MAADETASSVFLKLVVEQLRMAANCFSSSDERAMEVVMSIIPSHGLSNIFRFNNYSRFKYQDLLYENDIKTIVNNKLCDKERLKIKSLYFIKLVILISVGYQCFSQIIKLQN